MKSQYLVLIEKGESSYGACIPDLPGCIAVAKTVEEVKRLIREAMAFHIEEMLLDGDPIPQPATESFQVSMDVDLLAKKVRGKNGSSAKGLLAPHPKNPQRSPSSKARR